VYYNTITTCLNNNDNNNIISNNNNNSSKNLNIFSSYYVNKSNKIHAIQNTPKESTETLNQTNWDEKEEKIQKATYKILGEVL
jgi:hypothetical protein